MDFPFVVYKCFDSRGGESQISIWNADIIGMCSAVRRWRVSVSLSRLSDSLAGKDQTNLEKVINAFGIASAKAQVTLTRSRCST
jgi:hypothetical protein